MQINDARSIQRFLAYFIDMLIIQVVLQIILRFIPAYQNALKAVNDYYSEYLNMTIVDIDSTIAMYQAFLKSQGISLLVLLPIYAIYFVLIPYFWQYQTIGRLAMGLRVVKITNEEKVGVKELILREIIGGYLLYHVLGISFIIIIITWVFSSTRGRSVADFIGSTRLINTRIVKPEPENPIYEKQERDYIDAKFKEVHEEQDSNDDQYKVF